MPRPRSQEFPEAGAAVRIVRERVLESRLARSGRVRDGSKDTGLHHRPHGQAQAPTDQKSVFLGEDADIQVEDMQLE